jgi:hypothetical protein
MYHGSHTDFSAAVVGIRLDHTRQKGLQMAPCVFKKGLFAVAKQC